MLKKNLLIIPESRKRPLIESLLYKQIIKFFKEENLENKFEIKFISINGGIIDPNLESASQNSKLPPQRFPSGKLWIKEGGIEKMAENIVKYFYKVCNKYNIKIVYVRGSYLEAIKLARKKSSLEIKEIFTEDELTKLKKKGWLWMKVGLRMPEAFEIFEKRIKEFTKKDNKKQLQLPI